MGYTRTALSGLGTSGKPVSLDGDGTRPHLSHYGFSWNLLGYAVQESGVRQIASVTGVYGLSFLAVSTSALVAWVVISPRRAHAGLALADGLRYCFWLNGGWLLLLPPWARNSRSSSSRMCLSMKQN